MKIMKGSNQLWAVQTISSSLAVQTILINYSKSPRIHSIIFIQPEQSFLDNRNWNFVEFTMRVVSIVILLLLLIFSSYTLYHKQIKRAESQGKAQYIIPESQVLGVNAQDKKYGLPVRLIIPSIDVDATVENVGLTFEGLMEIPDSIEDVGWFDLGPRPGEKGNAVIAGHFNGSDGEMGVFADLSRLKAGDRFYTEDDAGITTVFTVRKTISYDPGYADEVFASSLNAHLNLITCDGIWNEAARSYTKRLVVFADKIY